MVGPTFACLIADQVKYNIKIDGKSSKETKKKFQLGIFEIFILLFQFRRLKFGDRFFYTHDNANGLGKVAREQVLQRTLGNCLFL